MCWIESRWEKPDDFIPHSGDLLSSKVNEKSLGTREESKSSDSHSDSDEEQEAEKGEVSTAEKGEVSTETQKIKIKFKVGSWFTLFKFIYLWTLQTFSFLVEDRHKMKMYFGNWIIIPFIDIYLVARQ